MEDKREKVIKKVENHLRMTSRQLVKFDTEEEALQYLTDSFQSELSCDFVGVILKENDYLVPKVWSGELQSLKEAFPLRMEHCFPALFHQSLTYKEVEKEESCAFLDLLKKEVVKTWFTVPLQDDTNNYGFCTIGYLEEIPLLQMDKIFDEFGRDAAVALTLAKRKEKQRKKMMGMEWISQNILLDESVETLVSKLVERAGKGTHAKLAGIYLYNENENCFTFQPPSYGEFTKPKHINIEENYELKGYFPFIETPGGNQLTVPMVLDLKTIGVLHVEQKINSVFTQDDLEVLELMANHVASTLENVRLYNNEKDNKKRLHALLDYQQKLIIETVEKDNFDGITSTLSSLFAKPVILFDRFMRPISYQLSFIESMDLDNIVDLASAEIFQRDVKDISFSVRNNEGAEVSIWPVNGGGDLLGYLAVAAAQKDFDDFDRLTVDMVRNIYSIQFIKQKLVLDAKEQVKDSFVNKLLVNHIENKESIIQYANLFHWDPFKKHRVSVLSIQLDEKNHSNDDLLEQQAKKSLIMEQLKTRISMYEQDVLLANKEDDYILLAPAHNEQQTPRQYWSNFVTNIKKWLKTGRVKCHAYMGIGGIAHSLEDYYSCYQEAVQALNVVAYREHRAGYAFFEELGSYTLLHELKHSETASLFITKQMEPLLTYSEGKNMDLFQTLRIYLKQNGSIKKTSEELYIHRSSLLYRLEKIENILDMDLNNSDNRFDLTLAYKLYDLQQFSSKK
ncbi:helix-turn-helix domain-containing protein [Alteribacillus sp. JSM 102045]|uniref:helix-turn-helix domain-containing protein n=1 Tax=Alteribacillus sp. JSM 102045 TaxID=1562101 RepID=UPI0035C12ADD